MTDEQLESELGAGYGIFSGQPAAVAGIVFTASAARWVADETWHPDQCGQWLDDGRYRLDVPYAHGEELLRDVLAYGPDAEIVEPTLLRAAAARRTRASAALYQSDD